MNDFRLTNAKEADCTFFSFLLTHIYSLVIIIIAYEFFFTRFLFFIFTFLPCFYIVYNPNKQIAFNLPTIQKKRNKTKCVT